MHEIIYACILYLFCFLRHVIWVSCLAVMHMVSTEVVFSATLMWKMMRSTLFVSSILVLLSSSACGFEPGSGCCFVSDRVCCFLPNCPLFILQLGVQSVFRLTSIKLGKIKMNNNALLFLLIDFNLSHITVLGNMLCLGWVSSCKSILLNMAMAV